MKLNANAFGLAVGVVLGLVSFVATAPVLGNVGNRGIATAAMIPTRITTRTTSINEKPPSRVRSLRTIRCRSSGLCCPFLFGIFRLDSVCFSDTMYTFPNTTVGWVQ